jgi:hypothetical protein
MSEFEPKEHFSLLNFILGFVIIVVSFIVRIWCFNSEQEFILIEKLLYFKLYIYNSMSEFEPKEHFSLLNFILGFVIIVVSFIVRIWSSF